MSNGWTITPGSITTNSSSSGIIINSSNITTNAITFQTETKPKLVKTDPLETPIKCMLARAPGGKVLCELPAYHVQFGEEHLGRDRRGSYHSWNIRDEEKML